jgi:hypothetical protein
MTGMLGLVDPLTAITIPAGVPAAAAAGMHRMVARKPSNTACRRHRETLIYVMPVPPV